MGHVEALRSARMLKCDMHSRALWPYLCRPCQAVHAYRTTISRADCIASIIDVGWLMANKQKKIASGKRYSAKEKAALVAAWHKNLKRAKPLTKGEFCASAGITSVSLNAWLGAKSPAAAPAAAQAAAPAKAKRKAARRAAPAVVETQVVTLAPVTVITSSDGVVEGIADLVRAIEQNQANINELKGRLRQLVDAL